MDEKYMKKFARNYSRHMDNLADLLYSKHQKYGNTPITKSGLAGIIVKLDMKIERLRTLESVSPTGTFSSFDERDEWKDDVLEQLIDIAGYGMLGLMFINGELNK